jgi:hypothetical protein
VRANRYLDLIRKKLTGNFGMLHSEELRESCRSHNTVRKRWAGHVARMKETIFVGKYLSKYPHGRPRWRWNDIAGRCRGVQTNLTFY